MPLPAKAKWSDVEANELHAGFGSSQQGQSRILSHGRFPQQPPLGLVPVKDPGSSATSERAPQRSRAGAASPDRPISSRSRRTLSSSVEEWIGAAAAPSSHQHLLQLVHLRVPTPEPLSGLRELDARPRTPYSLLSLNRTSSASLNGTCGASKRPRT